ncbi:gamma-glutamyltranspeptidase [Baekduia soli]|uniref:Gamma-glutamyltranspeptidase n=1 Tax=Baekduia soli TaxID=496014 RepID=A0A5B8TZI6_9ACTN|nr:gamma-glutamyltransferase [Baekduia soli]QEC46137.1 gamma-glutamyltranspeptidase [Baekduia soli]
MTRPTHGAVAAPQAAASEAAIAAYRDGGNAMDAALAAALSLTVVYPNNCALGGDLIALVHRAGRPTVEINASGPSARATDPDAVRARHAEMPVHGTDPITVPGLVAGLHAVWSEGGRRPWADAFAPAVAQAREGVAVPPSLAHALQGDAALLAADPGMREVFLGDDGAVLGPGGALRQPALARSLELLADGGPDALYRGELGASLLAFLRAQGSVLDAEDLAGFAPERGAPLSFALGEDELLTSRPNTQGFLLALLLGALEHVDPALDPLGPQAASLARIAAATLEDRRRHLCDPRFTPVPLDVLLGEDHLREVARRAAAGDAPAGGGEPGPRPRGDTVAIVTADGEGNAVCLIQSLFHAFGSGLMDPATGIICHNRGAYFTLDRGSPNRLEPSKRPAHTLMPSMLLRDGRPVLVLGTMGGSGQAQILAHVHLHLRRGLGLQEALHAPRWVVGGAGAGQPADVVLAEGRVPATARASLATTGLPVTALDDFDAQVGHAQAIRIEPGGTLTPASDPRSEGAALVSGP